VNDQEYIMTKQASATKTETSSRSGRAPKGMGMELTPGLARLAKEMTEALPDEGTSTDAIALLKKDHRKVEELFEEYEGTESNAEKGKIASKICLELRVHAQIEEELLYPPAHDDVDEDLVDEAIIEHAGAKDLIAQIEAMKPGERFYDAKVKVLSEYIKHHVKEEEKELFPKLKDSDIDLKELGNELLTRKTSLLQQLSGKA
jgi:hypothetical protein